MSNINTNNINTNYPVPGVNNSSQPFRDNFSSIVTNLNTAYTEITDLQTKVVVKSALAGVNLNNNMANTLISNALVRTFRHATYNLGASLTGIVAIDVTLGDLQYGTITANSTLQFSNWAPAGTQSNLQLTLNVSNSSAVITFPNTVKPVGNWGVNVLENYSLDVTGNLTVTVPAGVDRLDYILSTQDCGSNISIMPINRPQKSTQIVLRTPTNIGLQGDVAGTMCADNNFLYICTGSYDGITQIWRRIALTAF